MFYLPYIVVILLGLKRITIEINYKTVPVSAGQEKRSASVNLASG